MRSRVQRALVAAVVLILTLAGHRETWDALLPRSINEIRRESIRYIDAGERHSLAISDARQLWVWGHGVHGEYEVARPDLASTSILHPIPVGRMSEEGSRLLELR